MIKRFVVYFVIGLVVVGGVAYTVGHVGSNRSVWGTNFGQSQNKSGHAPATQGTNAENSSEKDAGEELKIDALVAKAKIDATQAQGIAQATVSGTIIETELEEKNGTPVYEVEIITAKGKITEVEVNAVNGKIIKMKDESEKEETSGDNSE